MLGPSTTSGTELHSADLESWPALPYAGWVDTYETLHRWMQVVGKVRLALAPHVNHWWEVPLYPTARGLTTSPIPHRGGAFEIRFDFVDHLVSIEASSGARRSLALRPRTVADFYSAFMEALRSLGVEIAIDPRPAELRSQAFPLDVDEFHHSYDREAAHRFWIALLSTSLVLARFRTRFIGKSSPIHFFWGGFDLAASLFSGRRAPERPGADAITREGYSHEVQSFGFWPGDDRVDAAFYAYAAPEPAGYSGTRVRPAEAYYHPELHLFLLEYEALRRSGSPAATLLAFYESAYEAGVTLGGWDREALERHDASAAH